MIEKLTESCEREDCRITGGNTGTSTCMGWTPVYDKRGNRIDASDPNIFTTSYACSTCGREWTVRTQRGETTISERQHA